MFDVWGVLQHLPFLFDYYTISLNGIFNGIGFFKIAEYRLQRLVPEIGVELFVRQFFVPIYDGYVVMPLQFF